MYTNNSFVLFVRQVYELKKGEILAGGNKKLEKIVLTSGGGILPQLTKYLKKE